MNILLVEPFFTGSHAAWAQQLKHFSQHHIHILSLPGRYWKWRMRGAAVTLAEEFNSSHFNPDLIIATDMLDLSIFLALTRSRTAAVPVVLYFHENQLTYPWSLQDPERKSADAHYPFINMASALAADYCLFNSEYHRRAFLDALPEFCGRFPDYQIVNVGEQIEKKSRVFHLGLDLKRLDLCKPEKTVEKTPLILWNHRWEFDKNPETFFEILFSLDRDDCPFRLAVLGESYRKKPAVFAEAQNRLKKQIVQFGYAQSFEGYGRWLWQADILPVTSRHDFFGISVVEAIYCDCWPILPAQMAYPEHLPGCPENFYTSYDELEQKLRKALAGSDTEKHSRRSYVEKYDWYTIINAYDRTFSEMK